MPAKGSTRWPIPAEQERCWRYWPGAVNTSRCVSPWPTNGPEDFAFATDRVFAPGRGRKMRFCTNWQIYADDITIRSGRWLDGVYYSDEERSKRVKDAAERESTARVELEEAFRALGFDPGALGEAKGETEGTPNG